MRIRSNRVWWISKVITSGEESSINTLLGKHSAHLVGLRERESCTSSPVVFFFFFFVLSSFLVPVRMPTEKGNNTKWRRSPGRLLLPSHSTNGVGGHRFLRAITQMQKAYTTRKSRSYFKRQPAINLDPAHRPACFRFRFLAYVSTPFTHSSYSMRQCFGPTVRAKILKTTCAPPRPRTLTLATPQPTYCYHFLFHGRCR